MLTVYCKFRLSEKCWDDRDRLQVAHTRSLVCLKNPRCIRWVPRIHTTKHHLDLYGNTVIHANTLHEYFHIHPIYVYIFIFLPVLTCKSVTLQRLKRRVQREKRTTHPEGKSWFSDSSESERTKNARAKSNLVFIP